MLHGRRPTWEMVPRHCVSRHDSSETDPKYWLRSSGVVRISLRGGMTFLWSLSWGGGVPLPLGTPPVHTWPTCDMRYTWKEGRIDRAIVIRPRSPEMALARLDSNHQGCAILVEKCKMLDFIISLSSWEDASLASGWISSVSQTLDCKSESLLHLTSCSSVRCFTSTTQVLIGVLEAALQVSVIVPMTRSNVCKT